LIRQAEPRAGRHSALVSMRADLLGAMNRRKDLAALDCDGAFAVFHGSTGNPLLRRIDGRRPPISWNQIIRYEAVHGAKQIGAHGDQRWCRPARGSVAGSIPAAAVRRQSGDRWRQRRSVVRAGLDRLGKLFPVRTEVAGQVSKNVTVASSRLGKGPGPRGHRRAGGLARPDNSASHSSIRRASCLVSDDPRGAAKWRPCG